MEFVTVDRAISKVYRDTGGGEGFDETDIIERIGEALEFLQVPGSQEERLAFLGVRGHRADVPRGFQSVLRMERYGHGPAKGGLSDTADGKAFPLGDRGIWGDCFEPVRPAGQGGLLSCGEGHPLREGHCGEEYAIVGTAERKFLFSFKEGRVALAYLSNAVDPATGYPLVPDDAAFLSAISYYVRWKLAEERSWNGREGSAGLAQNLERLWLRYARQAKNRAKMPKGMDEFERLMEQGRAMLPGL